MNERKAAVEMGAEEAKALLEQAVKAREQSYSPYSGYQVGAALLCDDGQVFGGCNIENSAYTPTNCAERTAFFKAVSEGCMDFEAIAIVGGHNGTITDYVAPCGVCRQVMMEFCEPDKFKIILAKSYEDYKEYTLEELLPLGFKLSFNQGFIFE